MYMYYSEKLNWAVKSLEWAAYGPRASA